LIILQFKIDEYITHSADLDSLNKGFEYMKSGKSPHRLDEDAQMLTEPSFDFRCRWLHQV
jgi:hypothetical protein